jgi:aspartate/methionine/tyrosine aminotransferase
MQNRTFHDIGLSPIVEISERAKRLAPDFTARTGKPFVYFQRGEVDLLPPSALRQAIANGVLDDKLCAELSCYPKSGGNAFCKRAIAAHHGNYGIDVGEDEILVTYGGQEALELAFLLHCGSRMVALGPIWSCIQENIAPYSSMDMTLVPLLEKNGEYEVDLDRLAKALANADLLYLNSPHNPTGACLSFSTLEAINSLCLHHGVVIISDEAYKDIVFDGQKHVSMLEFPGDHIYAAFTGSKSFASTGFRFGWLVCRDKKAMSLLTRGEYTQTAGVNPLVQWAFSKAMESEGIRAWMKRNCGEFQDRRDAICDRLGHVFGDSLVKPGGAFYFFLDLNPFLPARLAREEKDAFVLDRMLRNGIAVVPGSGFGGTDYAGFIRISYSTVGQPQLSEGTERLAETILSLND